METVNMTTPQTPPIILSPEEINDPYLVLESFFDYARLPHVRDGMWQFLRTTVCGDFNTKMLSRRERGDLLYLYEQLGRLVEASHLILVNDASRNNDGRKRSGDNAPGESE